MMDEQPTNAPPAAPPPPANPPPASRATRREPEHLAAFRRHLESLTPRVWVTPALIAINVALFVAFGVIEHAWVSPTTDELLRWGANFGPRTANGQVWRLLASTFLHIGILHILFNMFVLWEIGRFVERLVGNVGFLALYLVCGLAGQLASMIWNPYIVSAGASGAIFGLYGVLLGFLARSRGSIPKEVLQTLQKSAVVFIGYNVFYGLMRTGIDNSAHLGGLGMGFLLGLVVAHPLTVEGSARRTVKALGAAAAGLALVAGVALAAPKPVDLGAEVHSFGEVETQVVNAYNQAYEKLQKGQLNDAAFAKVIDEQVLPPWKKEHTRFAALAQKHMPEQQKEVAQNLVAYIDAREQWWSLLSKAARDNDQEAAKQAEAKKDEIDRLLKKLSEKQQ